jgi:hypothetical protein
VKQYGTAWNTSAVQKLPFRFKNALLQNDGTLRNSVKHPEQLEHNKGV